MTCILATLPGSARLFSMSKDELEGAVTRFERVRC